MFGIKRDHYLSAKKKIEDGLLKKIGQDLVVRYAGELANERLSSAKAARLQAAIKVVQDVMCDIQSIANGAELSAKEIRETRG